MKKILTLVCTTFSLLTISCGKYDDTAIKDSLDGFEERLEKLEELCKEVNTNMTSLQELIKAIQNNDVITGITAITKDGETIGYTITFLHADPITIYNGANGAAGNVPQIGARQDEDGSYYWTVDGEWLLDENGNKVKADEDNPAPRFKIADGFWFVSYDNGDSWEKIGPATSGESGESIFADVEMTDDGIIFVLTDGSKITVPTGGDASFIDFLDNTVELLCIMNWDTNGDDRLSYEEAAAVDSIGTVFKGTNIISFNEFKYFTSVKKLDANTFDSCHQLRRISLPESLEQIEHLAFSNMAVLPELIIPASVNFIADYAIAKCPALVKLSVAADNATYDSRNDCNAIIHTETNRLVIGCNSTVIPEDTQAIAQVAFWGSKIQNVVIPDSVTSIEYQAFRECSSLQSVSIGNGVKEWGTQVFAQATGDYYLNSDIPDSPSYNKSVFYVSNMTNLTIGPDVTTLGNSAFSSCSKLKKVVIPKNVVNIRKPFVDGTTISELEYDSPIVGKELFKGLGMTKVTLGENVETIEEAAFKECKSLKEVIVVGDGLKTIGKEAFRTCNKLNSINFGNSLETIGDSAFYGDYSILEIVMPSTVTSLGEKAFYECTRLASVVMSDNIEEIKQQTFYNSGSLKTINMPANLRSIGAEAFYQSGITSAIFPKTLSEIGGRAFYSCTSMQNIEVNSVISVPTAAFNSCSGVLTINAPLLPCELSPEEQEYTVDSGTFSSGAFTKVIIGKDVKEIPNGTFYQCTKITEVVIEEGLEIIGPFAFDSCINIKTINLPSTLTKIGAGALSETAIESITIPESITVIAPKTLRSCSKLTEVILPESLTEIGNYAFAGCISLKEITIPKNVTKLGSSVFDDCKTGMGIYCMPSEPPTIGFLGDATTDISVIYVPAASLEKYKSAWEYNQIVKLIQPYDFE